MNLEYEGWVDFVVFFFGGGGGGLQAWDFGFRVFGIWDLGV